MLLGRLCPDLLDLIEFTARAGLLGNAIKIFILLPDIPQIFLLFMFGIIILYHSFCPTNWGYYQSVLGGLLVGLLAKTVLSTM